MVASTDKVRNDDGSAIPAWVFAVGWWWEHHTKAYHSVLSLHVGTSACSQSGTAHCSPPLLPSPVNGKVTDGDSILWCITVLSFLCSTYITCLFSHISVSLLTYDLLVFANPPTHPLLVLSTVAAILSISFPHCCTFIIYYSLFFFFMVVIER